jgi:hypothetical protein
VTQREIVGEGVAELTIAVRLSIHERLDLKLVGEIEALNKNSTQHRK